MRPMFYFLLSNSVLTAPVHVLVAALPFIKNAEEIRKNTDNISSSQFFDLWYTIFMIVEFYAYFLLQTLESYF